MEPAIIRLAQTYVGHVRRVGVSFCTLYMALRLSCLICAPETNYWMWVVLIFEALWTCMFSTLSNLGFKNSALSNSGRPSCLDYL